jgi:hypothetical protein
MQGRVRSFPHEKNNWASFVYIDVSDIDLDDVRNFLVKVKTMLKVLDIFIVPGICIVSLFQDLYCTIVPGSVLYHCSSVCIVSLFQDLYCIARKM